MTGSLITGAFLLIALACVPIIAVSLLVILVYCVRIHNRVSGIEDRMYSSSGRD